MHDSDLPNVFVIGAPKCGTTSLFHWLSGHPEICASDPKETYFFADRELDHLDIRPNHRQNGLPDYLSLFEPVNELTRVKMEGSTHYLYSDPALDFVSEISPHPRVIVQLRNPAIRIWSHFNYIKQKATRPIEISFPDYVDAMLSAPEKSFGNFSHQPWAQYLLQNQLSYSNYIHHLGRWLDRFQRDHIKILILEDLSQQKRRAVQNVAKWIEVDSKYFDDHVFKTVNAARSRVSNKLRRRIGKYARYFPQPVTDTVKTIVDKSLKSFAPKKSTADNDAIAKLEDYFATPNQSLQREFGLDLSSWRH